jgi:hypothetical protein
VTRNVNYCVYFYLSLYSLFYRLPIGATAAKAASVGKAHPLTDRDILSRTRFEEAYLKYSLLVIAHEMSSETAQALDLNLSLDMLLDSVSGGAVGLY